MSERVSAVRGAVFSQGVEVRRATDYVCMFGISVPAGIDLVAIPNHVLIPMFAHYI